MNRTQVVASLAEVNQLFGESRDSINSCWLIIILSFSLIGWSSQPS